MRNSIFLFFLVVVFSCAGREEKSTADKKDTACEKPLITDSELALLMRKMDAEMRVVKDCILSNKPLPDSISLNFANIHTAIPTDPSDHNENFTAFAGGFLSHVDRFKQSDTGRTQLFNAAVQSCVDCHQSFCPGPIERIGKLKIKPVGK